MLDASSQLMLDSAPSQAKSDYSSKSNSPSENGSTFSSYMEDAKTNAQPKEAEKQSSQSGNQSTAEAKTRGFSRSVKKNNQASAEKKPADNTNAKTDKSESVKANSKPQTAKTAEEATADNAEAEVPVESKQVSLNKLTPFNPMLLLQNKPEEINATADEESVETGEAGGESVQAMVAKILQSRTNTAQHGETLATPETDDELLANANLPQGKISEIAKAIAPEASDLKTANVTQKQNSLTSKNPLLKSMSDDEKTGISIEESAELDDKKVDEFVSKIFEKLNLTRSNLESLIVAKSTDEKTQFNNELIDQLSEKISGEMLDKTNIMANSLNSVNQRSNTLLPTQQLTLNTHINQPEWGSEFGKRIQFMINNNVQTAELRLDPPELGRINVKINLSSDQANISFTSAHQNVRDAIENTLPKLRELLAESGLQLGNADVASQFQQRARDQERENSHLSGPVTPQLDDLSIEDGLPLPKVQYSVDGVIDYFV